MYLIKTDANGAVQWEKTFGGALHDVGTSAIQASDGGYVMAGYTYERTGIPDIEAASAGADQRRAEQPWGPWLGDSRAYIVKTDSTGSQIWSIKADVTNTADDSSFNSVREMPGGGFIAAGSYSTGSNHDVYLLMADAKGNVLWERAIGRPSQNEYAQSVAVASDGGLVVAGRKADDVYLIKADSKGNVLWEKTFGGSGLDLAHCVMQTMDGGYIISGDTDSFGAGGVDMYLIKTDSNGDMQWEKTFGGAQTDRAYSLAVTMDGGYAIAGTTEPAGLNHSDMYFVRTDSSGNALLAQAFGRTGDDWASSLAMSTDGQYVMAGATIVQGGRYSDAYLIKVELSGIM